MDLTEEDPGELKRQLSMASSWSIMSKEAIHESQKLIKKEKAQIGGVKWQVYLMFIRAATFVRSFLYLGVTVTFFLLQISRNYWLSAWSNEYHKPMNMTTTVDPNQRLLVFAIIGATEAFFYFTSLVVLTMASTSASRNLHRPLIANILKSPMSFFDTTPIGRILNRCTSDIDCIDMNLPAKFRMVLNSFLQVFFAIAVIVMATPFYIVAVIPLGFLYFMILIFYMPTSRQLKRLEGLSRSPLFSNFGETVNGITSIRAFGKGFLWKHYRQPCKYMTIVGERWLATRLLFIGNLVVFFAALFSVISKDFGWSESPGIVGMSIAYAINIIDSLTIAVRQLCMLEANIVAVERVEEYTVSSNEAPWTIQSTAPPTSWPCEGMVSFSDYSSRYRGGLDLVLKSINLNIKTGEKVGIVGRTGAGKSSFALALFRLTEAAEGAISIDDVNIENIGLHQLRSSLTIIPQDPVLFSGTLRFNLDPFDNFGTHELWNVIELAHLKEHLSQLPNGLDHEIAEGGENMSVRQRQLICLARALLRKSKILVLDEATAAVDVATDTLIQKTIRKEYAECTIITIAHRINTIMDYDRILVLDNGRLGEFASPEELLKDRDSMFSKLVAESNSEEQRN